MMFTQFNEVANAIDDIYEVIIGLDSNDVLKKDYEVLISKMHQLFERTYNMVDCPDL